MSEMSKFITNFTFQIMFLTRFFGFMFSKYSFACSDNDYAFKTLLPHATIYTSVLLVHCTPELSNV